MIDSHGLRRSFIDYFVGLGHTEVPSAPLIPHDDPTLLFTNAGMNQFKRVFLGEESPPASRVADLQKCLRVSGKHNDLEEVGTDEHHHTFFEMMGNWSFDDYYKAEAIEFAWNYLTKELKLDPERLWPTVFEGDTETRELWPKVTGISANRVLGFGEKDNFWEMGDVGPCGPCTEIHYDYGPDYGPDFPASGPNDVRYHRWVEIWNLVFIQYHRDENGSLTELGKRFVDTGMGFERLLALLQGVPGNYWTDLFIPIMTRLAALTAGKHDLSSDPVAFRAIADHMRTLVFGISDGVYPSNEGRGYVLRRILRRAARYGRTLGLQEPFLYRLVEPVAESMGVDYPEVVSTISQTGSMIKAEEESFGLTLDRGLALFEKERARLESLGQRTISADAVFMLYDTFGFPPDLTALLAQETGLSVDLAGFEERMNRRREDSRDSTVQTFTDAETRSIGAAEDARVEFVGYDDLQTKTEILRTEPPNGIPADQDGLVIVSTNPFYPESGGQVGDQGWLEGEDFRAVVHDCTRTEAGIIVLTVHCERGLLRDHTAAIARVDSARRSRIQAHHTGTHLLHAALRKVLGEHIRQAGSLVAPDRLRFDFNHFQPVTRQKLLEVEQLVNHWVDLDIPLGIRTEVPLQEAKKNGAIAFFGEKYGERVRVVNVPGVSMELCGGTHVTHTAQVGSMWIYSEGSVAAGVRRVEAACGHALLDRTHIIDGRLGVVSEILGGTSDDADLRAQKLRDRVRDLEQELREVRVLLHRQGIEQRIEAAESVCGIKVAFTNIPAISREEMRLLADTIRDSRSGVLLVIASVDSDQGTVQLLVSVTDDALQRGAHAGKIVSGLADLLGGRGGGRPHLAEAGARITETAEKALSGLEKAAATLLERQLCQ